MRQYQVTFTIISNLSICVSLGQTWLTTSYHNKSLVCSINSFSCFNYTQIFSTAALSTFYICILKRFQNTAKLYLHESVLHEHLCMWNIGKLIKIFLPLYLIFKINKNKKFWICHTITSVTRYTNDKQISAIVYR